MPESDEREFSVTGAAGVKGAWTLRFAAEHMSFAPSEGTDALTVSRADVPVKVSVMRGPGGPFINVRAPKNRSFRVSNEALEHFERWRGPLTMVDMQVALRQRLQWSLPIAVLWIIGSIPMAGDPAAGIAPIPFDPLGMALGGVLLGLAAAWRYRPDRRIFVCDAVWFLAITVDLVVDVARGDSAYWLLFVPLNLWFASSEYKDYQRFAHLDTRRVQPAP